MNRLPFLFELGSEELPPKALPRLAAALADGIVQGLAAAGLNHGAVQTFATPRRLAVAIEGIPERQADKTVTKRGPALRAAYKDDGTPTPAAEGFARSCGVPVSELEKLETAEGAWLVYYQRVAGRPTAELLPEIVDQSLNKLPIPKRMRWGSNKHQFVRPAHWVVMLLGTDVVPCTLLGLTADRKTRGHRFHAPGELHIPRPADYAVLLETEGSVMADFARRQQAIRAEIEEAALKVGGEAVIEQALLDEVTALVEWPAAITGGFDARFLALPAEALIAVMQGHQRYFHVVDKQGKLLPHFITIANIRSRDASQVVAGNERVIRPRLTDAEFFWNRDCKTPLKDRVTLLGQVVFQKQLGTVLDKVNRVSGLAAQIARRLKLDAALAERAAQLAKADLMSDMVGEFPELQGVMGSYYAQVNREDPAIVTAIADHYRPRFGGDAVATQPIAYTVAIADKLDTLVGIFGIGQPPSGEKDPYALRRAALGVQRTLIENGLDLSLAELLEVAVAQFKPGQLAADTAAQVFAFMMERLRGYYADKGFRADEFDAVLETGVTSPYDFGQRLQAVHAFRELPESGALAAANKRCRNILKKAEQAIPKQVDPKHFDSKEERALFEALEGLGAECGKLVEAHNYTAALRRMAALRVPVDAFFDTVMVMAEAPALRNNRLALLGRLEGLFLQVADISRLQE